VFAIGNQAFGADGAGTAPTLSYGLSLTVAEGTSAGLASNGVTIRLYENGGVITGSTSATEGGINAGNTIFTITVNGSGVVTLTQFAEIDHANNGDTSAPYDDQFAVLGANLARLTASATVTDGDGDTASDSAFIDLGGNIRFADDGPSVNVTATNESNVHLTTQDAQTDGVPTNEDTAVSAANFSGVFGLTSAFGADGPGTSPTLGYALSLTVSEGTSAGLASNGATIRLYENGGVITGSTAATEGGINAGNTIFTIAVNGSGVVTLTQFAEIDHANNGDTSAPYDDQFATLGANLVRLTASATITDGDGDTATDSAFIDLGGNIRFADDGPSVDVTATNESNVVLTTQDAETDGNPTSQDTAASTADFSGVFAIGSQAFGADGPGTAPTLSYALSLTVSEGSSSGLASNGATIRLYVSGGVITGSTSATEGGINSGNTIFTLTVNGSGVVTLTQFAEIDHANNGDTSAPYDDQFATLGTNLVRLTASATITDGDGDSASDSVFIDLGGNIRFADDGPSIDVTATNEANVVLTTQDAETDGNPTNQDTAVSAANFSGVFAIGSQAFGADGAGTSPTLSYALSLTVSEGTSSGLASNGATIRLYESGGVITGSTSATEGGINSGNTIFTIAVNSSGVVTLTQFAEIDHANNGDTSAPYDDQFAVLNTGLVRLTASASITDGDGDTASDSAFIDLGGNIQFADDGPSIDVTATNEANVVLTTQDAETDGNPTSQDTAASTANFSGVFAIGSQAFGADGAGTAPTLSYALSLTVAEGTPAGLASDGQTIRLYENGGVITGSTSATEGGINAGNTIFTIAVNGSGVVTLTQFAEIDHASNGDTSPPYDDQFAVLGANLVRLTASATITDGDGDTATDSAFIDLGGNIQFADDGPDVKFDGETTVNETGVPDSAANGTYRFFSGADGVLAGSLTVDIDGSNAQTFTPAQLAAGVTVNTAAGTLVLTAPDSSGNGTWTLTPVAVNATSNVNISITMTDGDGDSDTDTHTIQVVNVNQPLVIQGAVTGTVEEEHGLPGGNEDTTDQSGLDTDENLPDLLNTVTNAASGTFASLVTGGADGTLTFSFAALGGNPAVSTVSDGPLTSGGRQVYFDIESGNLIGYYNANGDASDYNPGTDTRVFTITLNSSGAYTFTLEAPVDHPIHSPSTEDAIAIDLNGRVVVSDAGGPPADTNVPLNASITVIDDVPVAFSPANSVVADTVGGSVTALLDVANRVGADAPLTVSFDGVSNGDAATGSVGGDPPTALTSGGLPIYLYNFGTVLVGTTQVIANPATITGIGQLSSSSFVFRVTLDPDVGDNNYTFEVLGSIDNGSGVSFSSFSEIGSPGNNDFVAADQASGTDLIIQATVTGSTANTATFGSSVDFGVNNQSIGDGEGLILDFVTLAATVDSADDYTGHNTVNGVSFTMAQIQGSNTTSDVFVRAFNADDDGNFEPRIGDAGDTVLTITGISINGTMLTPAQLAALDVLNPDGFGNGVVLQNLAETDVVVVYTSSGFDRLQISNAVDLGGPNAYDGRPFSVTAIAVATVDSGDPVTLNFDVQLTDSDGDTSTADFNVTLAPPPAISVSSQTVAEAGGFSVFTVSLSSAASYAITANLALANGTATGGGVDFGTAGAGNLQVFDGSNWVDATSVTFNPGQTSVQVRTPLVNDGLIEAAETFTLIASAASGTSNGSGEGTTTISANAGVNVAPTISGLSVTETGITFNISDPNDTSFTLSSPFATAFGNPPLTLGSNTLAPTQQGSGVSGTLTVNDSFGGAAVVIGLYLGSGGNNTGVTAPLPTQSNAMYGFDGNDNLTGGSATDFIFGGNGTDTLTGGGGADTLSGGANNDTFNLANGDFAAGESIDGGSATDSIVLTNATTVDFTTGTIAGVETLIGSNNADVVTMSATQWAGLTTISMNSGSDTVNVLASGTMDISGGLGPITLTGIDVGNLIGTTGDDTITLSGTQLNNILQGSGSILLDAGTGDTINLTSNSPDLSTLGTAADNRIQGLEIISAAASTNAVSINLSAQTEAFTVTGSRFDDTITGGAAADTLNAGGGNDFVTGGSNDTLIDGGTGRDQLTLTTSFTSSSDAQVANVEIVQLNAGGISLNLSNQSEGFTIYGTAGTQTITGGTGNDLITAGAGADAVNGGGGTDTFVITDVVTGASDSVRVDVAGSGNDVGEDIITGFDLSSETLRIVASNVSGFAHGSSTTIGTAGGGTSGASASSYTTLTGLLSMNGDSDFNDGDDIVVTFASPVGSFSEANFEARLQYDLTGTSGNDSITTGALNDTIRGMAGADTITSGAGNDIIIVGSVPAISSDSSRVTVFGNGNDTGQDTIVGFDLTNDTLRVVATNVSNFVHGTDTAIGTAGAANDGTVGSFTALTGLIELNQNNNNNWGDTGDIAVTFSAPTGGSFNEANFEARLQYDLTGTSGVNVLTGGALNDVLAGENANDTLTGGGGVDTMRFTATGTVTQDTVLGYQGTGADRDILDVSSLLDAAFDSSLNINNFVRVSVSGADALVQVDTTGSGNFTSAGNVATLSGYGSVNNIVSLYLDGIEQQVQVA
jgi:Ca2+-binding RTX toxin-like protein